MTADRSTCRELAVLVTLRATGALDPADEARVESHLAGCRACRADAEADAALLELAALAPPSEAERRAVAEVPARALAQVRRGERRRATVARRFSAVAVAVLAAAVLLAPAFLWRGPLVEIPPAPIAWQEPDVETLWEDTQVLELEPAADERGGFADAAYAALGLEDG